MSQKSDARKDAFNFGMKGKHKGRLGALICETKDGVRFKIGTGFTDADREHPPRIGNTVTFTYQEVFPSGAPRFPSFLRIRHAEPGRRK
jgi:DNA ligase-1